MNTIAFEVIWTDSGQNKIAAIKAVRAATHCSLKEGKDAVEACKDKKRTWHLNAEQFGNFVCAYWSEERYTGLCISEPRILKGDDTYTDFTKPSW